MPHLKVKYSTTGRGFFFIPIVFSLSSSLLLTPERVLGLLPAAVEQRLEDVRAHQADLLRLLGRRVRRRLRMRRQRRHLRHHNLAVPGQDGGVRHLRVVLRLHLCRRKGEADCRID